MVEPQGRLPSGFGTSLLSITLPIALPGADVQCSPLLPSGARPGIQSLYPQRGHRQHVDQGCVRFRHR